MYHLTSGFVVRKKMFFFGSLPWTLTQVQANKYFHIIDDILFLQELAVLWGYCGIMSPDEAIAVSPDVYIFIKKTFFLLF